MKQSIKLKGVAIKTPSGFKIERYNITKSGRLSNGSMHMELIAKKRKFYLTWAAITASELNTILNLIWETNSVFFSFEYIENNVRKSATVYAGSIPTDLYRTDPANWVWKDVQINFIER